MIAKVKGPKPPSTHENIEPAVHRPHPRKDQGLKERQLPEGSERLNHQNFFRRNERPKEKRLQLRERCEGRQVGDAAKVLQLEFPERGQLAEELEARLPPTRHFQCLEPFKAKKTREISQLGNTD